MRNADAGATCGSRRRHLQRGLAGERSAHHHASPCIPKVAPTLLLVLVYRPAESTPATRAAAFQVAIVANRRSCGRAQNALCAVIAGATVNLNRLRRSEPVC